MYGREKLDLLEARIEPPDVIEIASEPIFDAETQQGRSDKKTYQRRRVGGNVGDPLAAPQKLSCYLTPKSCRCR